MDNLTPHETAKLLVAKLEEEGDTFDTDKFIFTYDDISYYCERELIEWKEPEPIPDLTHYL